MPQTRAWTTVCRGLTLKATVHQRDDLNCFLQPTGGHPFAKNAPGLAEREILIFLYFQKADTSRSRQGQGAAIKNSLRTRAAGHGILGVNRRHRI